MDHKIILALAGAIVALAIAPGALARGPAVTVRVEGRTHALLAPTVVHTRTGWITKFGAPKRACSASSAQGALDTATHGHWGGRWSTSFNEYEIFTILGERDPGTPYYWEIFRNNLSATTGGCQITLRSGDQLLFAAVPYPGAVELPLRLIVPAHTSVGRPFTIKVVYYTAKGKPKPLAGATVSINGHGGKTGKGGTVSATPSHAGTYSILASDRGYIRAAPVTLHVS